MNLNDMPLFSMLRGRMGHLDHRQRVIAENVANADTPGYAPRDVRPFSFAEAVRAQGARGIGTATTHRTHIAGRAPQQTGWNARPSASSEVTLDGNGVVLEEEMLKMSEARVNYDAAVGFYQKSLGLLRLAARAPGR